MIEPRLATRMGSCDGQNGIESPLIEMGRSGQFFNPAPQPPPRGFREGERVRRRWDFALKMG